MDGLAIQYKTERREEFLRRIVQPAVNQLIVQLPMEFRACALPSPTESATAVSIRSERMVVALKVEQMGATWSLIVGVV